MEKNNVLKVCQKIKNILEVCTPWSGIIFILLFCFDIQYYDIFLKSTIVLYALVIIVNIVKTLIKRPLSFSRLLLTIIHHRLFIMLILSFVLGMFISSWLMPVKDAPDWLVVLVSVLASFGFFNIVKNFILKSLPPYVEVKNFNDYKSIFLLIKDNEIIKDDVIFWEKDLEGYDLVEITMIEEEEDQDFWREEFFSKKIIEILNQDELRKVSLNKYFHKTISAWFLKQSKKNVDLRHGNSNYKFVRKGVN